MKKIFLVTLVLTHMFSFAASNAEPLPDALPPINAFSSGMGFSGVGFPDNPATIYWNPGGVGGMNQLSIDFSIAAQTLEAPGSWSFLMANSAAQEDSRIGFGMIRRHARFADGQRYRSFEILLPLAHRVKTQSFPIGITPKFIMEQLAGGEWHSGMALDFGVLWITKTGMRIGYSSLNAVGSALKSFKQHNWLGVSWISPEQNVIIGSQINVDRPFDLDFWSENYRIGIDYEFKEASKKHNSYAIRSGYVHEGDDGWAAIGFDVHYSETNYKIGYTMSVNPDGWKDRMHVITYGYTVNMKKDPSASRSWKHPALP